MGEPQAKRGLTFAEVVELDPDDAGGELTDGHLTTLKRNTWRHGEIVVNLVVLLKTWAKASGGFSVAAADPGTKLGTNPDILRGPDVGVIRSERRPPGQGTAGWLEGAPDVAIEVAGDNQSPGKLAKKALEYLAAGAQQVWVVDARAEHVLVYTPPSTIRVLSREDTLDGEEALPGFSCMVKDIFDA